MRRWLAYAALCALALAAYANSFALGLALDGSALVKSDPRIVSATAANLRLIFTEDYWFPFTMDQLYRPLTTLSFLFNCAILHNGDRALGYHSLNFLLHAANVCLVFALCRRILANRAAPAFCAAALWAVHPAAVEAVANIAGRADLLSALAILAALILHLRTPAWHGRRRAAAYAALFLLALAGVLSKESGAALAGLMLLTDYATGARLRLPAYAAALAALAPALALRLHALADKPAPYIAYLDNPLAYAGFWSARLTALRVAVSDLGLLLWPANLACDRSYHQIPLAGPGDPAAWLAPALLAALAALLWVRRRGDRVLPWCAGFFALALLPASNLLLPIGAVSAERFLYLPAVGFTAAAAALVWRLRWRTAAVAVVSVAVAAAAARTHARNADWKDDLTILSHDVHTAPAAYRIHFTLGKLLAAGDTPDLGRALREAESAWAIVEALPPERNLAAIPALLGSLYLRTGDAARAAAILNRAAAISQAGERDYDRVQALHGKPSPDRRESPDLYLDLGQALSLLNRPAEAVEAYRRARAIHPANPTTYSLLADAYRAAGDSAAADTALLEQALVTGAAPPPGGDRCAALAELTAALEDARQTDTARRFQQARRDSGCP